MLCHALLYDICLSMKKWDPSHCVSEVHLLSDIFKICCQLQVSSNQGWQDSSCAPFMSCFGWFCMHKMYAQTSYVLSQQMGWNNFYTFGCKLRLCANNSVLAVRWNFIVDKTLRKKNPTEEKPKKKSLLGLSLRSAIILWLLASPFWLCSLALEFIFISLCFACIAAIPVRERMTAKGSYLCMKLQLENVCFWSQILAMGWKM